MYSYISISINLTLISQKHLYYCSLPNISKNKRPNICYNRYR